MKAFFSKIWTWILAHKIIAIVVASVLVVGTTCAIVLPIALHEHSYATEWSSDADNHWHDATCKHEEEKSDLATHTYTNACDSACDVCGYTRTVGAHVYDNACDNKCNVCSAERTVEPHVYDNACDTTCNVCGATRTITHDYADTLTEGETTHWYACSVCGDKKDETAHVFDKTVASSEYLKAEATATTKAQYYKSCVCGAKSATEYFETDKTAATITNIQDLSKTYDKVALADPTYETNSDGAVTIEWYKGTTKLDAKPVNAGTYKVKVIIAESATYAGVSAEKEFTIAKKVLSGLEAEFVYNGNAVQTSPALATANGVVAGDNDVVVKATFASKSAGASVTGAVLESASGAHTNYELDLTTCTASIVPKVLTNISVGDATTYKGSTNFSFVLSAYHGLVSGETFTLQVTTVSKNVGNAVEIASISYNNSNYSIDKSAITLNIVPKALNLLDIEFTYDGGNIPNRFDLTAADGVIAGDDVWLYGDGWQGYDVAYDEYTLTDDLASDDYDEGVELRGADKGNYKFTYDTDGSVGKITVMPYILDFIGEYVKDADGTHYLTFTKEVTLSGGDEETVTVKLPLLDLDGQYITNAGVYTQENAQFGPPEFYVDGGENLGYDLDDSFYATESEFEVTVLSTDDLVLETTGLVAPNDSNGRKWFIIAKVLQGTLCVGDDLVLSATSYAYTVEGLAVLDKEISYAFVGDTISIELDGQALTSSSEIPTLSLLYRKNEIPEMASEFFATVYLKTKDEGGRQTAVTATYTPDFVGLGAKQNISINILYVYGKTSTAFWAPGETALIKLTLATPLPASLLETLTFSLRESTEVATGTACTAVESHKKAGTNAIFVAQDITLDGTAPVLVKLTNETANALNTLEFFAGESHLTDFSFTLYDDEFAAIAGTYDSTTGAFTLTSDSSRWALAADESCYVVLTATNAAQDVAVWLW